MDDQQKAQFLAQLRETPDRASSIWFHHMRGGISAIITASLLMKETLAEQPLDQGALAEMMDVIDEKAQDLLGLMEIYGELNLPRDGQSEV